MARRSFQYAGGNSTAYDGSTGDLRYSVGVNFQEPRFNALMPANFERRSGYLYNGYGTDGGSWDQRAEPTNYSGVGLGDMRQLAQGGYVNSGEPVIVGDGGQPEVFVPDQPGYVYPSVGTWQGNVSYDELVRQREEQDNYQKDHDPWQWMNQGEYNRSKDMDAAKQAQAQRQSNWLMDPMRPGDENNPEYGHKYYATLGNKGEAAVAGMPVPKNYAPPTVITNRPNDPDLMRVAQIRQQQGLDPQAGPDQYPNVPMQGAVGGVGLSAMQGQQRQPMYMAGQDVRGLISPGNIDLTSRPQVKNPDGSVSTVRSMSFNVDGKEVLIPTVSDDGRIMSDREAMDAYRKTGKNLGIFDTPENATNYAQSLHGQQERMYLGGGQDPGMKTMGLPIEGNPAPGQTYQRAGLGEPGQQVQPAMPSQVQAAQSLMDTIQNGTPRQSILAAAKAAGYGSADLVQGQDGSMQLVSRGSGPVYANGQVVDEGSQTKVLARFRPGKEGLRDVADFLHTVLTPQQQKANEGFVKYAGEQANRGEDKALEREKMAASNEKMGDTYNRSLASMYANELDKAQKAHMADPMNFGVPFDRESFDKSFDAGLQKFGVSPRPPQQGQPAGRVGLGQPEQTAPQQSAPTQPQLPPQVLSKLREGVITKFNNGQAWTIQNGQPKRVQ